MISWLNFGLFSLPIFFNYLHLSLNEQTHSIIRQTSVGRAVMFLWKRKHLTLLLTSKAPQTHWTHPLGSTCVALLTCLTVLCETHRCGTAKHFIPLMSRLCSTIEGNKWWNRCNYNPERHNWSTRIAENSAQRVKSISMSWGHCDLVHCQNTQPKRHADN